LFRVKICGVTCQEDAMLCADAGVDAIGLNFYRASPRCIDVSTAKRISTDLLPSVAKVGVFVNMPLDQVATVFDAVRLDFVQLHGDEKPEAIRELGGRPAIKAFRCKNGGAEQIHAFLRGCLDLGVQPAAILIDAFVPGSYGGTGVVVDWKFVAQLRPEMDKLPIILAGGITPENVAQAILIAKPSAIDTASGVESAPGKKDSDLTRAFVENAKSAFGQLPEST
jgi:phosphoribosylanthranilate isomerase